MDGLPPCNIKIEDEENDLIRMTKEPKKGRKSHPKIPLNNTSMNSSGKIDQEFSVQLAAALEPPSFSQELGWCPSSPRTKAKKAAGSPRAGSKCSSRASSRPASRVGSRTNSASNLAGLAETGSSAGTGAGAGMGGRMMSQMTNSHYYLEGASMAPLPCTGVGMGVSVGNGMGGNVPGYYPPARIDLTAAGGMSNLAQEQGKGMGMVTAPTHIQYDASRRLYSTTVGGVPSPLTLMQMQQLPPELYQQQQFSDLLASGGFDDVRYTSLALTYHLITVITLKFERNTCCMYYCLFCTSLS